MDQPSKTARQLLEAKRSDVTGVISIAPGDTVLSALKLMQEKDIGAVVVLEDGKLKGIFTERDYAREVELQGKMAKDVLVHQIMTGRPIFYATPGDSIEQCRALMGQGSELRLTGLVGTPLVALRGQLRALEGRGHGAKSRNDREFQPRYHNHK